MTKITIRTNNHERELLSSFQVPSAVLNDDFGYLEADSYGFFCYKKHWYHTSDFMSLPAVISGHWEADSPLRGWDAYSSDSYFSGVLIKYDDDGETIRIGTYIS